MRLIVAFTPSFHRLLRAIEMNQETRVANLTSMEGNFQAVFQAKQGKYVARESVRMQVVFWAAILVGVVVCMLFVLYPDANQTFKSRFVNIFSDSIALILLTPFAVIAIAIYKIAVFIKRQKHLIIDLVAASVLLTESWPEKYQLSMPFDDVYTIECAVKMTFRGESRLGSVLALCAGNKYFVLAMDFKSRPMTVNLPDGLKLRHVKDPDRVMVTNVMI
jgi:hypothetical protein